MTDRNRNDLEAITEKWLQQSGPCDGGLPMGCTHPSEDPRPVIAALVEELEWMRRGAKTLGHIVETQGRMALDITGRHDLIGEDGDGDWGAVWDHAYELLPRARKAEAIASRANVDDLARVIWEASRADEGTISAAGAQSVARAVATALVNAPAEDETTETEEQQ